MLTKCLNPACDAQFRYMHQGRLLHLRYPSRPRTAVDALLANHRREPGEFFWLCHNCAEQFQVIRVADGFKLVPMYGESELLSLGHRKASEH